MIPENIINKESISYVKKFGLNLRNDPFPCFLLAILFGARISENIASRTFSIMKVEGLIEPGRIIERGWEGLVDILDLGGYTRYDFKTATKILNVSRNIISKGGLKNIIENSANPEELVKELKSLSPGIGDVTVGIFMREIVDIYKNAKPMPSKFTIIAMENLGLELYDYKKIGVEYAIYEYFLHKIGKLCLKKKCSSCPVSEYCLKNKLLKNTKKI